MSDDLFDIALNVQLTTARSQCCGHYTTRISNPSVSKLVWLRETFRIDYWSRVVPMKCWHRMRLLCMPGRPGVRPGLQKRNKTSPKSSVGIRSHEGDSHRVSPNPNGSGHSNDFIDALSPSYRVNIYAATRERADINSQTRC